MRLPNSAIMLTLTMMIATPNGRLRKVRRSMRARSWRCSAIWRVMKAASASTPTVMGIHSGSGASPSADSPRLDRPKIRPPNASVESTTERMSNGSFRGVVRFVIFQRPSVSATSAMGSTIQNIQRQDS